MESVRKAKKVEKKKIQRKLQKERKRVCSYIIIFCGSISPIGGPYNGGAQRGGVISTAYSWCIS